MTTHNQLEVPEITILVPKQLDAPEEVMVAVCTQSLNEVKQEEGYKQEVVSRNQVIETFLQTLVCKGISTLSCYLTQFYEFVKEGYNKLPGISPVFNPQHCFIINGAQTVHPPILFFSNAHHDWKSGCIGYFNDPSYNDESSLDMVEEIMFKRFRVWGLKFITYDENGYFLLKFDNENFVQKLITNGPLYIHEGLFFVFHQFVSKHPPIKSTHGLSPTWIEVYNIPVVYWSLEGLRYIAESLGSQISFGIETYEAAADNKPLPKARIQLFLTNMHSKPQHLSLVVPAMDGGFTHALVTIMYESEPPSCKLCYHDEHVQRNCPNGHEFKMDFTEDDCSRMFVDISSSDDFSGSSSYSTSAAESQMQSVRGGFRATMGRGLASEVPQRESPAENQLL